MAAPNIPAGAPFTIVLRNRNDFRRIPLYTRFEIEDKVLRKFNGGKNMFQRQFLAVPAALGLLFTGSSLLAEDDHDDSARFNMVVSAGAKACVPNASATVRVTPGGPVEIMDVVVQGLPPNTEFDFFVLQVPKAPFGVSWYQGDIQTDKNGRGHQQFIGRFSIETFAIAPGTAPAPAVFSGAFPDASLNPPFNPIQMYHLGLWFGFSGCRPGGGLSGHAHTV
jgi:hypothetical protein